MSVRYSNRLCVEFDLIFKIYTFLIPFKTIEMLSDLFLFVRSFESIESLFRIQMVLISPLQHVFTNPNVPTLDEKT